MATVPRQAYEGQPGTGAAVLATVPANRRWMSLQAVLANTSGSPASVTLGKNGVGAAQQFVPAVSILGNTVETLDLGTGVILEAGETVEGLQGTGGAITVHLGVIEEDV